MGSPILIPDDDEGVSVQEMKLYEALRKLPGAMDAMQKSLTFASAREPPRADTLTKVILGLRSNFEYWTVLNLMARRIDPFRKDWIQSGNVTACDLQKLYADMEGGNLNAVSYVDTLAATIITVMKAITAISHGIRQEQE